MTNANTTGLAVAPKNRGQNAYGYSLMGYYIAPRRDAMIIPCKQNTAKTITVEMHDANNDAPLPGLTLVITLSKAGGAFSSISPTVTDRGNGQYAIALTTSHLDTVGMSKLYITASLGVGAASAQPNDKVCLDVYAHTIDDVGTKTDFLPSVTAGANGGIPLVGSQIPNANASAAGGLPTLGTGAGQLNVDGSGAVDGNVKKWLGTATATPTVAGVPKVEVSTMDAGAVTSVQSGLATASAVASIPTNPLLDSTTRIPSAAAGAIGGLSTITAIGQGPGGVLKPNSMEDNMVYSSAKLTSSRLRVFASSGALASAVAGHADNADGEVERYVSAVTYNVDGTVASFKWTKQL